MPVRVSALNQLASPGGTTSSLSQNYGNKLLRQAAELAAMEDERTTSRKANSRADLLLQVEMERLRQSRESSGAAQTLAMGQLITSAGLGGRQADLDARRLENETTRGNRELDISEKALGYTPGAMQSQMMGMLPDDKRASVAERMLAGNVDPATALKEWAVGQYKQGVTDPEILQILNITPTAEKQQTKFSELMTNLANYAAASGDKEMMRGIMGSQIAASDVPANAKASLLALAQAPEPISQEAIAASATDFGDQLGGMLSSWNWLGDEDFDALEDSLASFLALTQERPGVKKKDIQEVLLQIANEKLSGWSRFTSNDAEDTAVKTRIRNMISRYIDMAYRGSNSSPSPAPEKMKKSIEKTLEGREDIPEDMWLRDNSFGLA